MDLEQLERSVLEANRQALAPAASDRMRNQASLLEALKSSNEISNSGKSDGGKSNNAATGSTASAGNSLTSALPASALPTFPWRASTLGLTVGLVLGGLVGFGLGQQDHWGQERQGPRLAPTALSAGERTVSAAAASSAPTASTGTVTPATIPAQQRLHPEQGKQEIADIQLPSPPVGVADTAAATLRKRRTKSHSRSKLSQPASSASTLAAELALLQRARRALRRGNGRLALGIVHSLDEEFAQGVLLEERAATRVLALCQLERVTEARRAATQFLSQHPRSVYAERVRSACAKSP